ncbi:MAG: dihydropteroate synthase [Gammaproteobacteria bacterium]|nr:dihydropteroate synthase [Gammaproteobacteria bacterium]
MAILNLTPDSFSDGGALRDLPAVIDAAAQKIREGADVLDLGGESTRPGSAGVGEDEELARVLPAVAALADRFDCPLSIDTRRAAVMRAAVVAGAGLVNDVAALREPGAMAAVAELGVPVVLMHMRGEPRTMQVDPHYDDVVKEVSGFLRERMSACQAAGIPAERIILDPGFGFGKLLAHNLALLRGLPELAALGQPLLVGLSRKSMIGELTGRPVHERVHGSVALAVSAARLGAAILRVHDVGPTVDALRVTGAASGDWS